MGLGTQVMGVTRDREAAKLLAEYFYLYNPYWVRKFDPVWMSNVFGAYTVDYRSEEYTVDEQILINSYKLTDLRRFEFLVSSALKDGSVSTSLEKISIEWFDRGRYPHKKILEDARRCLMKRTGQPVEQVLAEVERRKLPGKSGPIRLDDPVEVSVEEPLRK